MVTLKVLRVDSVTVAKIAGLVAVIVPKLAVGAVIVPSSAIAKPVNVVLEQTKFRCLLCQLHCHRHLRF